eukprot:c17677_g1_i2.p1 GENE.c17677_g1_i2~~c17677_g1_i2.p1  ORF type:complete len:311 (+),score=114.41 c17677_g1_i2:81-1013(+)
MNKQLFIFAIFFIIGVNCHGRLSIPTSRDQKNGVAEYLQNEPVSGLTSPNFVCRGQAAISPITVVAGSPMVFKWIFTAEHVGDCFLYVSYDSEATWFKISNFLADESPPRDCRVVQGTNYTITIPSWLPAGNAVFRWEWYALHVRSGGTIEYYSQCFDATVTSTSTVSVSSISPKVTIGTHLPTSATAYRDGFSPACDNDLTKCSYTGTSFLVGPALATDPNAVSPSGTPPASVSTSLSSTRSVTPSNTPTKSVTPTASLSFGASPSSTATVSVTASKSTGASTASSSASTLSYFSVFALFISQIVYLVL